MSDSVYLVVGGDDFFAELVDRFYARVVADGRLAHMYPDDLTESRASLTIFLVQYFGGPGTYSESKGHPRLRMRHAPFDIGPQERDAWLSSMLGAVESLCDDWAIDSTTRDTFVDYFTRSADHMVNTGLSRWSE